MHTGGELNTHKRFLFINCYSSLFRRLVFRDQVRQTCVRPQDKEGERSFLPRTTFRETYRNEDAIIFFRLTKFHLLLKRNEFIQDESFSPYRREVRASLSRSLSLFSNTERERKRKSRRITIGKTRHGYCWTSYTSIRMKDLHHRCRMSIEGGHCCSTYCRDNR
jgi:hypothetical protein